MVLRSSMVAVAWTLARGFWVRDATRALYAVMVRTGLADACRLSRDRAAGVPVAGSKRRASDARLGRRRTSSGE